MPTPRRLLLQANRRNRDIRAIRRVWGRLEIASSEFLRSPSASERLNRRGVAPTGMHERWERIHVRTLPSVFCG